MIEFAYEMLVVELAYEMLVVALRVVGQLDMLVLGSGHTVSCSCAVG